MTKKEFVEGPLAEALRHAELGIETLELEDEGNHVRVFFTNGYKKLVEVGGDSHAAIIMDVTMAATY